MLITARAEYACLAMIELAAKSGSSKPVRLVELTDPHGIPSRFVVQILLQMKQAGLVHTTRGPSGGYRLAKPAHQITLAEILSVVDRFDDGGDRTETASPLAANLQNVWKGLASKMTNYLKQYTLADLIPKAETADYVI